jgi:uncharacterized lipoprotein YddW (UPF0748 family)
MGIAGTIFVGLMATVALFSPAAAAPPAEIRGTWVTTTANDAISTPEKTAQTMRRLREIGLNTVYVECWKNGYTQYPSKVLERTIGVDRRPALMAQDPGDDPTKSASFWVRRCWRHARTT